MFLKNISKQTKSIIYAAAAAALIAACIWAFIYSGSVTKSFRHKIKDQTYNTKEAGVENLLITETKDGQKLWEMFADTGIYAEKNGVVLLENLIGSVYDDKKVKASFKADKGTYNANNKQIILYDNVIMVYEDGTNIKTDKLIYSGKNKPVTADGNVRIERPDEAAVIGAKAVLSADYKHFDIQGRTVSRFYMRKKAENEKKIN